MGARYIRCTDIAKTKSDSPTFQRTTLREHELYSATSHCGSALRAAYGLLVGKRKTEGQGRDASAATLATATALQTREITALRSSDGRDEKETRSGRGRDRASVRRHECRLDSARSTDRRSLYTGGTEDVGRVWNTGVRNAA